MTATSSTERRRLNALLAPQPIKDKAFWLEWNLQNWKLWHLSGGVPDGMPSAASGGMSAEHADFDDMCQSMDRDLAATCEAVIDDLSPVEQCAVYRHYLSAVYRFREDFITVLERARQKLAMGLKRKGVWLGE